MNKYKIMKVVGKGLIIIMAIVVILIIAWSEYLIFFKCPRYANPQSGIVKYTYESKGRGSSCWFAEIAFDNGDYQEVNTGNYEYKIGDRFIGQLNYTFGFGNSGFAYSWNPGDWLIFAMLPGITVNIFLIIIIISCPFILYYKGKKHE